MTDREPDELPWLIGYLANMLKMVCSIEVSDRNISSLRVYAWALLEHLGSAKRAANAVVPYDNGQDNRGVAISLHSHRDCVIARFGITGGMTGLWIEQPRDGKIPALLALFTPALAEDVAKQMLLVAIRELT